MRWIEFVQDREKGWTVEDTVMNTRNVGRGKFHQKTQLQYG